MEAGCKALRVLPTTELHRLTDCQIADHLRAG